MRSRVRARHKRLWRPRSIRVYIQGKAMSDMLFVYNQRNGRKVMSGYKQNNVVGSLRRGNSNEVDTSKLLDQAFATSVSTAWRNSEVVGKIGGIDTQTSTCKCRPESAFVRAVVTRDICLQPGITRIDESRIARLYGQGVEEQMKEDDVAFISSTSFHQPSC